MRIGSGWTKTTQDGGTSIGVTLEDSILELCPQLKGVRFSLKWLSDEQRGQNENTPHWALNMYKPQETGGQNKKNVEDANKAIAAQGQATAATQPTQSVAASSASLEEEISF